MIKFIKKLIIMTLLLLSNTIEAQVYIGNNNFGKLEFVNDSICELTFYNFYSLKIINKCSFVKREDTIYISSQCKMLYTIDYFDTIQNNSRGIPALIKVYERNYKNNYHMVDEIYDLQYDTILNKITINNYVPSDCIMVLRINPFYDIRCFIPWQQSWRQSNSHTGRVNITINIYYNGMGEVYLDKFPLLIRGKKIIPISKEKQEQCWIENGFYFPKMKIKSNKKRFTTMDYTFRSLSGLPNAYFNK